jgi:hypothetical protein
MDKITVISKHIAKGMRSSGNKCPVALALKDKFRDNWVNVNRLYIEIEGKFYNVPQSVKEFIDNFDTLGKGKPFSFFLKSIH